MQLFPAQNVEARQLPPLANHPCHTMMGVPLTALVLGGLAKPSTDCTQRAVSPPGRTAACACDCIGLGLFFFLFLQRPGPTVLPQRVRPGARATLLWHPLLLQRMAQVQIARTWLKVGTEHPATRCSEPGRAICIVCLHDAASPAGRSASCASVDSCE